MSKAKLSVMLVNMKQRCYNKKHPSYKNYGAKGITICKEWLEDRTSFYEWCMDNGWNKKLAIDKDILCTELGIEPHYYGPDTCMFVTPSVNNSNKINSLFITYNNETLTMGDWCKKLNIKRGCMRTRLDKGWSMERIVNTPVILYIKKGIFNESSN